MVSYNSEINSYVQKARLMGLSVKTIPAKYNVNNFYIVSKTNENHIVLIPDEVTELLGGRGIQKLKGVVQVIGGSGLVSTKEMFSSCRATTLDLSRLDTSNVEDMSEMFDLCRVKSLDLRDLDTHNVKTMNSMFAYSETNEILLNGIDTSKVTNMDRMFYCSSVGMLDLSSLNTEKVESINGMFKDCEAHQINLSGFNTNLVEDDNLVGMFDRYFGKITTDNKRLLNKYKQRSMF